MRPPKNPARQRIRRALLLGLLFLFPLAFNYWSPALPVMGALHGVIPFSLLFWSAWTVAALVAGRGGCGWFCPLAGLQEAWCAVGPRPAPSRAGVGPLRWGLFALWIAAIGFAIWRGPGLSRVDLLYQTEHVVSWDRAEGAIVYVGMLGLVLAVALPLGGRAFCRHLCWWAPPGILGARLGRALRLPQLRLVAAPDRCSGCGQCEAACPASLPVTALVRSGTPQDAGCVLCGSCADACPKGAVALRIRRREP